MPQEQAQLQTHDIRDTVHGHISHIGHITGCAIISLQQIRWTTSPTRQRMSMSMQPQPLVSLLSPFLLPRPSGFQTLQRLLYQKRSPIALFAGMTTPGMPCHKLDGALNACAHAVHELAGAPTTLGDQEKAPLVWHAVPLVLKSFGQLSSEYFTCPFPLLVYLRLLLLFFTFTAVHRSLSGCFYSSVFDNNKGIDCLAQ